MHNNHYPSFELSKKLNDIGFPKTEKEWRIPGLGGGEPYILGEHECDTEECKTYAGVCPSCMEMLDVMPKYIDEDELNTRMNGKDYLVMYVHQTKMRAHFYGTLPNALAEMILWLHENKYITF